jgi:protocatechuate 3,4-dioxygenase beta subunit
MHHTSLIIIALLCLLQCQAQPSSQPGLKQNSHQVVGGPFENGHFFYIEMPDHITSIDTSPGWHLNGEKLKITGTIYKPDGRTPASGVILYYYHTDERGYYPNHNDLNPQVVRHGYIRGWVKTSADGQYTIYTVRPAPYPNTDMPAHIHPAIKEPGIDKEYYIEEFVFDDDLLLTNELRQSAENRGGSGILKLKNYNGISIAQHDIILGLNIPNYPGKK